MGQWLAGKQRAEPELRFQFMSWGLEKSMHHNPPILCLWRLEKHCLSETKPLSSPSWQGIANKQTNTYTHTHNTLAETDHTWWPTLTGEVLDAPDICLETKGWYSKLFLQGEILFNCPTHKTTCWHFHYTSFHKYGSMVARWEVFFHGFLWRKSYQYNMNYSPFYIYGLSYSDNATGKTDKWVQGLGHKFSPIKILLCCVNQKPPTLPSQKGYKQIVWCEANWYI